MTDNEIIKALQEMADYPHNYEEGQDLQNALDLINRQKAEIDELQLEIKGYNAENNKLKAENSNLTSDLTSLQNDLTSAKAEIERLNEEIKAHIKKGVSKRKYDIKLIKAEAYKEFAEEIFELFPTDKSVTYITRVTVKHILKELKGDDK